MYLLETNKELTEFHGIKTYHICSMKSLCSSGIWSGPFVIGRAPFCAGLVNAGDEVCCELMYSCFCFKLSLSFCSSDGSKYGIPEMCYTCISIFICV